MSRPIRAACGDCGQSYRVPVAGRSYTCTACGGRVRAPECEDAPAPVLARPRAAEPAAASEPRPVSAVERRAPRPRASRGRRAGSARKLWGGIGATAVLALLGLAGLQRVRAGEPDLEAMAERFTAAWNDDSTSRLVGMAHPERRDEFHGRLTVHRETRGWAAGLPEIAGTLADLRGLEHLAEVGPGDRPPTSSSTHGFRKGQATVRWQYNASNTTWYVIGLELTAPAIGQRLEGFRRAWAGSDPAGLAPYLGSSSLDKLVELVEREASRLEWHAWPPLGEPRASREPEGDLLWSLKPVDVTYPTPRGELVTRWSLDREADAWVVAGFDFPDG